MVANNRRIVWVEVLLILIMLALISRRTRLKVTVARLVLAASPLVVLYGIVGWNSDAQIFAPVHTLRSVGDADIDGSTLYRDIENYNLLATLKQRPITGMGFGHPYLRVVENADISFFKEWLFLPHNSILGLWGVGGLAGFTGLWAVLVVGVYLSARRYFESVSAVERAAAFTAIASVAIYLIQSWGDIGFSEIKSIFLVGPALAIAGQLGPARGALRGRAHQFSRVI
jgi:O-antigen ligase